MDDDGKGTLDRGEIRKAMRELKVADLMDKAINHLFEYSELKNKFLRKFEQKLLHVFLTM